MNSAQAWQTVNQRLLAKSISELSFEEVVHPQPCADGGLLRHQIILKSGVAYRFTCRTSIWGHAIVEAGSIQRVVNDITTNASCAAQFYIDAQTETGMTDIILGNFLEEMHSTLFSDLRMFKKYRSLTADEVSSWDGTKIQSILNGHPKILLNKGRMGWGSKDLEQFAPENTPHFQLRWIAVEKNALKTGHNHDEDGKQLLLQSLSHRDIKGFSSFLTEQDLSPTDFSIIPVHPWQWDRVIQIQFAGAFARREMIDLGIAGDFYQPQISLRTLTNVTRPHLADIKLPLSILNTSAVRGIPSRYIALASTVSSVIANICQTDSFLSSRATTVLQDIAGRSYVHAAYEQVPGSPYRYRENIGVLWRESVASKIEADEVGILTASLFYQDEQGRSLVGAYVKKSGLTMDAWLDRYFDVVVLPLYHLQLKYGLGLVAHGQNIMLRLKNSIPAGIFLKDFQGDLRLAEDVSLENAGALGDLDRLPRTHLMHDLITGHFSTVLRFVSATVMQCDGFPESEFYRLLACRVENYLQENWDDSIASHSNILRPTFERVLVNKVRFNIGYADSSQRPLVTLGNPLANPLFQGEHL